jgi:hypothetical protein
MKVVYLVIIFVCISVNSFAGCTENFSWLPNQKSDMVIGYRIYYGLSNLGPYPMVSEINNPTIDSRIYASVSGLECGVEYYFVCVAYNSLGESENSIQVAVIAGENKFKWTLFLPAIINN